MAIHQKEPFTISAVRVIDGDTLEAWVQVSHEVRQLWRIRLKGVEGGELPTEQGLRATSLLQMTIQEHGKGGLCYVGMETVKDQFGRHVGDIRFADGTLCTRRLIETGAYWRRSRNRSDNSVAKGKANE